MSFRIMCIYLAIVSFLLILSSCNSSPTRAIGDLTPEEQEMLYSPDLNVSLADLGASSIGAAAAPACGNVRVIYNSKTGIQTEVISQTEAISRFKLAVNYPIIDKVNMLKTAIKNEYGDRFSLCWTTISFQYSANSIKAIGRFADVTVNLLGGDPSIGVTSNVNASVISSPFYFVWNGGSVSFKYSYDGGAYEALISANLMTGWLTRVNHPAGNKTTILDYPLMGYWRGTTKFSDMVSFKPVSNQRISILFPDSLGIEPLAVTSSPAANIPNAPRISIKDYMNSQGGTITAQWQQNCDGQTGPYRPCPTPTPKTPTVTLTVPPLLSPPPCEKQDCGKYIGYMVGNIAYSAAGMVTLAFEGADALVSCTVLAFAVLPCIKAVALATLGHQAAQDGANRFSSNSDAYNACVARNASCKNTVPIKE
jgi:hypothetical protein